MNKLSNFGITNLASFKDRIEIPSCNIFEMFTIKIISVFSGIVLKQYFIDIFCNWASWSPCS